MLALIDGSTILSTAAENSWCDTPVGRVTAVSGWTRGTYRLATVLPADPVPVGKAIASTSVQMVGGLPKEVHALVDQAVFDTDSLNAALQEPGSVVRSLGLVLFSTINAQNLVTLDAVNELRTRAGLTPFTVANFRQALASKQGQDFYTMTEFLAALQAQMR